MWERLAGGDSAYGLRRLVTAFFLAAETLAAFVAESGCILPSESRTCARTNQRGLIPCDFVDPILSVACKSSTRTTFKNFSSITVAIAATR